MQPTLQQASDGRPSTVQASADVVRTPSADCGSPVAQSLRLAYGTTLLVAALVVLASAVGLTGAASDVYAGSSSVLVSPGSDAANLLLVPLLVGTMWVAQRGSLLGLLLWPGALIAYGR